MKAKVASFVPVGATRGVLTLELFGDFRAEYDRLHDQDVEVTIKKYRPKRSLDANAYAWVLIDKIADRMHLTKEEVYQDHIKTIGGVSETLCIQDKAVEKFKQAWEKHGLGWCAETFPSRIDGCTNVTVYYGSSTYDTKQFSALLDSLSQSCRILGIEVRPQEEIDALLKGEK